MSTPVQVVAKPLASYAHYNTTLRHSWVCVQPLCDGYHHWWRPCAR